MKDTSTNLSRNIAYYLALMVTIVWSTMTLYITFKLLGIIKVQQGVDFSGILGIYAGVTGLATHIIGYYFGSSKGSDDKSKQIDTLMNKPTSMGNIEKVGMGSTQQNITPIDLFNAAISVDQLKTYEKYIVTPEDKIAYDNKLKEFNN